MTKSKPKSTVKTNKQADPLTHINLGSALDNKRKFAEAEAAFRKAIELKPDYAAAYNNLGNALREQKKLAEAEAAFRKAIELKPDYAEAHNNLGNALTAAEEAGRGGGGLPQGHRTQARLRRGVQQPRHRPE